MDLNIKIIEGVQQFPALYDNCSDLDERNHSWVQLAEKLNMHVQILQIRWHALLQLYQKDANFKYANIMRFVYRNEQKETKADNWPEFVITEEYLKSYNNEDQEQFIFLEAEEENNSHSLSSSKENDCNNAEETQMKTLENTGENSSVADNVSEEIHRIRQESQDTDNRTKSPSKSRESHISNNTNMREKEEIASVDLNKNNMSVEEPKEKSSEKTSSLIEARCEDVIFGELVSATLKRMDENKKKNIKKEIMNLLFS